MLLYFAKYTSRFFLRCHLLNSLLATNDLRNIEETIDFNITNLLLCGDQENDYQINQIIFMHTITCTLLKIHKDWMKVFSIPSKSISKRLAGGVL